MALAFLILTSASCSGIKTHEANAPPSLFIEANGNGATRQQALHDAFREAIQKTYGVLIKSELRVDNDRLTKDVINEYSSAIISKYDVLNEGKASDGNYKIRIAALVSSSKLLDYVLANTKAQGSNKADGSQIYAQISTALRNKQQGDRLLQSIASDFPTPALKANLGTLSSRIDQDRQVFLRIPYKIEWNKYFLESFQQIIEYVSTRVCLAPTEDQYRCQYDVLFSSGYRSWPPKIGYKFTDNIQADTVKRWISPNVGLTVNFMDKAGRKFDSVCLNINLTNNQKTGALLLGPNNSGVYAPLVYEGQQYLGIGDYSLEGVLETQVTNIQAIEGIKGISPKITPGCPQIRY